MVEKIELNRYITIAQLPRVVNKNLALNDPLSFAFQAMEKHCRIWIFGILSLLFSVTQSVAATQLAELVATANERKLYTTEYWHVLMHYRPTWFGWESEVDDPTFFLAPQGKTDPEVELRATLKAFFEPLSGDLKVEHPQCRFVARFSWLKEQLGINRDLIPVPACKSYHAWVQRINPGSVTLIFSNYYIDAPASMFGHTLLRINAGEPGRPALLNYAVNYAALVDPETTGLIEYGFKGVFGRFKGVFNIAPYYFSVLSYNDIELRDIWEYDLNFSKKEITRLTQHLWELRNVYFDYYFFKENCSYHLLSLLESARPGLRLRDRYTLWTLPVETIHDIINQPGLVSSRTYRPSRWSFFQQQLAALNSTEKRLAITIIKAGNLDFTNNWDHLPVESRSRILDLLIEFYSVQPSKELDLLREQALLKRALLRTVLPPMDYPPATTPPETGHSPIMASLTTGQTIDRGNFGGIALRLSLHDLLDREQGFIPNNQIEFIHAHIRSYEGDENIRLNDLTFVKIVSLNARSDFNSGFSWKMDIALRQDRHSGCLDCLEFIFNPAGGVGVSLLGGVFYTLGEFRYRYGAKPDSLGHPAVGIDIGYLLKMSDAWRIHLESASTYPADDGTLPDLQQQIGLAWSPFGNHSLRFNWWRENDIAEHEAGYRFYF